MSVLGLDLGTKTLGIAISKTNIISNPYKTIRYDNIDILIKEVLEIINKENVNKIILGLPKNMNNTTGDAAKRSIEFKERLEQLTNIPIILIDERLSTVEAENILLKNDMSRKKRKDIIDSAAAMIILDTYLRMESNYGKK